MTDVTPFGVNPPVEDKPTPEAFIAENVGEGKKYANAEEALLGLAKKAIHADEFIATLKNEKQEVVGKYEELSMRQKTADEILAQIKGAEAPKVSDQTPTQDSIPTEEKVQSLVQAALREKEVEAERVRKDEAVRSALLEAFNNDEAAMSKAMYDYVGDSDERMAALVNLGHQDPEALVRVLKSSNDTATFSKPSPGNPGIPVAPKTSGLSWSQCMELKKSNPTKYRSIMFQTKMSEAAANNPNFYNT